MKYCSALILGSAVLFLAWLPGSCAQEEYDACYSKGLAYALQGKFTQAEVEFQKGLATDYPFTTPLQSCLDILKDLASQKIEPEIALDLFKGISYVNKGDAPKAMASFSKVIKHAPAYAIAYNERGSLLSMQKNYDQALADFGKAISLKPQYAKPYLRRGATYALKGDNNKAFADFNQALLLDPRYPEAYTARGNCLAGQGRLTEAVSDFTKAINLYVNYEVAYISRAQVYARMQRYQEAAADLDQSIALSPQKVPTYLVKAQVCERAQLYAQALAAYKKFVEIAPFSYMDQINYAQARISALERIVSRLKQEH